jgi:hypothetical protein
VVAGAVHTEELLVLVALVEGATVLAVLVIMVHQELQILAAVVVVVQVVVDLEVLEGQV